MRRLDEDETMSRANIAACCLALAACGPKSQYHDYSTPERAARSFIEAGRVGDTASARQSVVKAERSGDLHIDYGDIGDYSLTLERLIHDEQAVVILKTGSVSSPVACLAEDGEWKVTIRGTLKCMRDALTSSPSTDEGSTANEPSAPR